MQNKKILAELIIAILIVSTLIVLGEIQPANATEYPNIGNDDPEFQGGGSYHLATWDSPTHPRVQCIYAGISSSIDDGVAITQQSSTAGYSTSNPDMYYDMDCSVLAWDNLGEYLTTPQQVRTRVDPLWVQMDNTSAFNVFVEFWISFSQPTGVNASDGFDTAEVMFKLARYGTPDASLPDAHEIDNHDRWYFISKTLYQDGNPWDLPIDEWSEVTLDFSSLIQELNTYFDVELDKGTVESVTFGTEGQSKNGGIAVAWDYFYYELAAPIPSPTPTEAPTPSPTPTQPPTPWLTVQAIEYGESATAVDVYIDGNYFDVTECGLNLAPGEHQIEVPNTENGYTLWYTDYDETFLCIGQPYLISVSAGEHTITFYYIQMK